MASPSHSPEPLRDAGELGRAQLVGHFAAGEKPVARHRIGIEHEKVAVLAGGVAPGHQVIEPLLGEVMAAGGWAEVREADKLIGLRRSDLDGVATVSLEPGGQIELSDAPRSGARASEAALRAHLRELAGPARRHGLTFLGIGFRPFGTLDDVPWMPKGRYRVMRAYLPSRGALSHEMMKRTATVQVNFDYQDQADCARKLRAALGLSPLLTALYAASPLVDGRATDYQSYRAACWLATDEDRCGLLPFAFAADAEETLYARYAEWALSVPMFFLYRGGEYRPAGGLPFGRFLAEGLGGERATSADWELHLSTLFPEVRLKRYLEIRSADASSLPMVLSLPALARGLFADPQALEAGWALVSGWSLEQRERLRQEVPRLGLKTKVGEGTLGERCLELLRIARAGLRRQGAAEDEPLLEPLFEIAESGRSVADRIRARFVECGGSVEAMTEALALPLA